MDLSCLPSVQAGLSWSKLIISVESEFIPSYPPATIPKDLVPCWNKEQPWRDLPVFVVGPGVKVVVVKSTNQVAVEYFSSCFPPVTRAWVELKGKEQWP